MKDYNVNPINTEVGITPNYLVKTFLWMFLGLFATGFIATITYTSGAVYNFCTKDSFIMLMLVELIVVFVFSLFFRKLSPNMVAILYFVYAIINGVSMSTIFVLYELSSIISVFFLSGAVFGIFAFLGYKTSFDLSKVSNILFGILFAGIIVSIINIFIGSTIFELIIDLVILIVFFGITAYDVQKIKSYHQAGIYSDDKLHIYGAMEIYLDYINIFLRLLSLFGKRRD